MPSESDAVPAPDGRRSSIKHDRAAEAQGADQRLEGAVELAARDRAVERVHVEVGPARQRGARSAPIDLRVSMPREHLDLIALELRLRGQALDHQVGVALRRESRYATTCSTAMPSATNAELGATRRAAARSTR